MSGMKRKRIWHRILTFLCRGMAVLTGTALMLFLAVVGVVFVLFRGPSVSAQELFTRTLKETSAMGFLPDLFLPEERVAQIMGDQKNIVEEVKTDVSLITISATKRHIEQESGSGAQENESGVSFEDVTGASYRGIMMIVEDPTRIFLGRPDTFGGAGLTLEKLIRKYDAVGGINGGEFYDPEGRGAGGTPMGIVIDEGRLIWGEERTMASVIGFDKEGILHVGYMSGKEALSREIQFACSYGPALIINGQPVTEGLGSGINPRTAIGQREDGAVLMLVVDGRQITSLGANLEDLQSIMIEFGAVNAANLDGGSSSQMIYRGEEMNVNASVVGTRGLPTAFLLR